MKSIKKLSFIGITIIFVFNSSTIEKRIYSSGYHIKWKNVNLNSNAQLFVVFFLGLLLFITTGFPFIFGTLSMIFSAIGFRQTSKNGKKGKDFATAGLIIGILTVLAFWVVLQILFI